jgi:hypothetical protein
MAGNGISSVEPVSFAATEFVTGTIHTAATKSLQKEKSGVCCFFKAELWIPLMV